MILSVRELDHFTNLSKEKLMICIYCDAPPISPWRKVLVFNLKKSTYSIWYCYLFPKSQVKIVIFFTADFYELKHLEILKKEFFFIKHLQRPTSVMRKKPCGSRSGTQKSDRIMIRSPGSWSGAKLLRSGTKIKGFRMTEVGHEKNFFYQSFEIFQVAKIWSKKIHIFILSFGKR